MRYLLIPILIFLICFTSYSQTETYQGKPVNATDGSNLKQGAWVKFIAGDKTKVSEEGIYKDGKKEGIWKEYYKNGNLKSEITFTNNKPDGYAKLYYENGKLSEEGNWKGTKWIGNYKYYHENGKPKYEFVFTNDGKRSGKQKYYHENGKIAIEGDWKDGKEAGLIKEYYPDGSIKSEKNFADGKLDEATVKNYAQNETHEKADNKKTVENTTEVKTDIKKNNNNDVKVITNPTNPSEYKVYLSALVKKYPEGVTTENTMEGKDVVTRVIVIRNGNANEYKKKTTSWGQTFYTKNGQSISVSIFQLETKP